MYRWPLSPSLGSKRSTESTNLTALKPIENRRVHEVASRYYPSNLVCAHPECSEPVQLRPNGEPTVHHIFPRSMIGGDSYFVQIDGFEVDGTEIDLVLPHAVGLCGSGTTKHHGDVEEHRAWIKFEDGVFVWYDRTVPQAHPDAQEPGDAGYETWIPLGPLNPQPGSRDGKTKRKKSAFTGQARRSREVISIKVPADERENGAGLLEEKVLEFEAKRGWPGGKEGTPRPWYYVIAEALDYTLLNADATDFS